MLGRVGIGSMVVWSALVGSGCALENDEPPVHFRSACYELEAGSSILTMTMTYEVCVQPGCATLLDAWCSLDHAPGSPSLVSVSGQAEVWWREGDRSSCRAECERPTAQCSIDLSEVPTTVFHLRSGAWQGDVYLNGEAVSGCMFIEDTGDYS